MRVMSIQTSKSRYEDWIWEAEVRWLEAGIRAEAFGVWNEEGFAIGWNLGVSVRDLLPV